MKRPAGLTIFAVMNFLLAGRTIYGLLVMCFVRFVVGGQMAAQDGIRLTGYMLLQPLFTAAILIIIGIGFLKMNYWLGFIGGLLYSVFELSDYLLSHAVRFHPGFPADAVNIIYPALIVLALLFRYRKSFKADAEQGTLGCQPHAVPPSTRSTDGGE